MISRPTKRRLLALIDSVARGEPGLQYEATRLSGILRRELEPKRNESARRLRAERLAKKAATKAEARDEMSEIRAAIIARSNGRCEHCGNFAGPKGQADHWMGGSGRRGEQQSVETVWFLCRTCHEDRTANKPNAAYWNGMRKIHCERHGYEFVPHIEHLAVVRG